MSPRDAEVFYHYSVVRIDMPLGNQFAQLQHAAGESSPGNIPKDTHAVVLAANDEAQLLAIAAKLVEAGIAHVVIREPDAPFNGAASAIGLVPQVRTKPLKKILGCLPLLKGQCP